MRPPCLGQTGKTRPVPKARKMRVHAEAYRIPRGRVRKQHHPNGPDQNQGGGRVAFSKEPHRRSVIPRFYWVLPLFHPQLLARRTTLIGSDKESGPLDLGGSPDESFRNPKNARVHETSADPTPIRQVVRASHQRIGIRRGRHTLTGRRYQPLKTLEAAPPPHR